MTAGGFLRMDSSSCEVEGSVRCKMHSVVHVLKVLF
jgi:hypothetical protein